MNDSIRLDIRLDPVTDNSENGRKSGCSPHAEVKALSGIPSCSIPMLAVDESGIIREASEAALLMLVKSRGLLLNRPVSEVVLHLDEFALGYIFKAVPLGRTLVLDAFVKPENAPVIPCEISVSYVGRDGAGNRLAFLPLVKASSPEKAQEAVLGRTERLEVAGAVAGQIAHDFNNLLTPLLAYPELIRHEIQLTDTLDDYLSTIENTSAEMQHLTQQLLTLARRGRVNRELFCVNDVLEQVVKILEASPDRGIKIETDLADNLLDILGSPPHMQRVFENLCQNAIEAMGSSGVLRIKTENVYLDMPSGSHMAVSAGEYVKITIHDTGKGIPDDIRDKIFDPFFTTKRSNKRRGSGLGLSIVHGIIRDHHGYVDLDSTPGQGSRFYLYIPVSRQAFVQDVALNLPGGTESLLVVDDDPAQVQMLLGLLGGLGYTVKGAASGREALEILRNQRFDLILLDMVMAAGSDSSALLAAVNKSNPGQRVIPMSASAGDEGAVAMPGLRKPLNPEVVAKAVRAALARPVNVPGRHTPLRILIADDEQMIRRLFGMIIKSEFQDALIDQAFNGKEAVTFFAEKCHDLIIMDLQMPGQDGRESFFEIQQICAANHWVPPPIIFCTGFTPSESLAEIIKDSSIHCLLRKPVKANLLLETVRQRLGR